MKSKISATVFIILVFMFPGMGTFDSIKTAFTTKPTVGTIIECQHRKGGRVSYRSGTRRKVGNSFYAPVVETPAGDIARGTRYVGAQCDKIVGHKTLAFIHKSDPEKNRVGSFLQFWMMPSLMLMSLFWLWVPAAAIKTPVTIAYLILAGLGFMMDFGRIGFTKDKNDPLMTTETTLQRCAKKLADFKKLEDPKDLTIMNCQRLHDISGLADYPKLEKIIIRQSDLTDLSDLPYSEKLKVIDLYQTQIAHISDLPRVAPNLEELHLRGGPISDISPVADLKHLKVIQVGGTKITDISVLRGKDTLETATFLARVRDLTPLHGLPNLKLAGAHHFKVKIPCEDIEALKDSLSEDAVVWTPDHCK